ncbi:phosphohistidine phosphatase [Marinobacter persicus]|uniref:Phosphohistidine phosphatase n=1 Tax=Marinobacter persicus TaxID=930118 RepID=A0A1I3SVH2_9GAMM|nr:CHAD domain-containing protein [Marinobacter persicus]GHD40951.1 hypothetical protein GCM10008110_02380 [Marinobacter persicus]SFJ62202.1 phosphohistidine phosphatase [Marinobacter persicus]
MKHLYLVRHAKSSWQDDTLQDRDRPLNARGQEQLQPLARALSRAGALGGQLYASDARRARATLDGILPPAFPENRVAIEPGLYTFDYRKLLNWLQTLGDEQDTVTIVGHNPALLDLAGYLLKHPPAHLPTASFICLNLPDKPWAKLDKGQGRLENFLTPKEYSYREFARKRKKRAKTTGEAPEKSIPKALQHQLKRLHELEPGVRTGLDDEFLHQFRIALRRSRAIAESLKEITGDKTLAGYIKPLKQHARATSRLRDLHVFLQDLPERVENNGELQTALETWALTEAHHEHQALVAHMDSKSYRRTLHDWEDLLHSGAFRKLAANLATRDIAKAVNRRVRNFNRATAELLHNSPDEKIHSLRKQLKRIRYLMELNPEPFRQALKEMKERQELYGRFQDLHVQGELVRGFQEQAPDILPAAAHDLTRRMQAEKADVRRVILAMGGLPDYGQVPS